MAQDVKIICKISLPVNINRLDPFPSSISGFSYGSFWEDIFLWNGAKEDRIHWRESKPIKSIIFQQEESIKEKTGEVFLGYFIGC